MTLKHSDFQAKFAGSEKKKWPIALAATVSSEPHACWKYFARFAAIGAIFRLGPVEIAPRRPSRQNCVHPYVLVVAAVSHFETNLDWKVFLNCKTRVLFARVYEKLNDIVTHRYFFLQHLKNYAVCTTKNGSQQP